MVIFFKPWKIYGFFKGSLQRLFSPEIIKIAALGKSLPECYINHIVASLMFPLVRDTHILFAKS